jgi:hypothetical protein
VNTESQDCAPLACPVDCVEGEWSAFGACSKSCGTGNKSRQRAINVDAAHGGVACGTTEDSATCNTHDCPVDCVVGEWEAFGACSLSCNGGSKTAVRTATTLPKLGGKPCPALSKTATCNAQECPIDCVQTDWLDNGACSHSCGVGTMPQVKHTTTASAYGGKACDAVITKTRACTVIADCPVDCVMGGWGQWSSCTATCGPDGQHYHTRSVTTAAAHGGKACPVSQEYDSCNAGPCPVHCAVGDWTAWNACTTTCGHGTEDRSREILVHAENDGTVCPMLSEVRNCTQDECAIDCMVGDWDNWGACDASCNGGTHNRQRTIVTSPAHGGVACPSTTEQGECNKKPCPIDCQLEEWSEYSPCPVSCGPGSRTKTRAIIVAAAYGGLKCEATQDVKDCGELDSREHKHPANCPLDCQLGEWQPWEECTATCGGGSQSRTRAVEVHPRYGGVQCTATSQSRTCGPDNCPIDCDHSEWSSWSACTHTCGGGSMTQTRTIHTTHAHGGQACPASINTASCNTDNCPQDCVLTDWSAFGSCTHSCGAGTHTRTREIAKDCSTILPDTAIHHAVYSDTGKWGPFLDTSHSVATEAACMLECESNEDCHAWTWRKESHNSDGTKCILLDKNHAGYVPQAASSVHFTSGTCVEKVSKWGGAACGATEDTATCNGHHCAVDCVLGDWSSWGECSKTCNGGSKTRTRTNTDPLHGGAECPHTDDDTEEDDCNEQFCPIDCLMGDWTEYSDCSKTCGGGKMARERNLVHLNAHGGKACPSDLIDEVSCNSDGCPSDCQVGDWSAWGACTKSCAGGTQTRTRAETSAAHTGGQACPSTSQMRQCSTEDCPVDCVMGHWGTYTPDVSCGTGTEKRTRSVVSQPRFGGAVCSVNIEETKPVNLGPCPIHCQVGDWVAWSDCTLTCGGGSQARSRSIEIDSAHGGYQCPVTEEVADCETQACPKDCEVSTWSAWSSCSKTCEAGTQTRSRTVLKACDQILDNKAIHHAEYKATSSWGPYISQDVVQTRAHCIAACEQNADCRGWSWRKDEKTKNARKCFLLDAKHAAYAPKASNTNAFVSGLCVDLTEQNGGVPCPTLSGSRSCTEIAHCPVDCVESAWSNFGACDVTCGAGTMTKTRTIKVQAQHNGVACGATSETASCDEGPCPIHCEVGEFGGFSACSKSCGGGSWTRTRPITVPPQHNGDVCPLTADVQNCNTAPCPVDCVVGEWDEWSTCTKSCASGTQDRTRSITTQPAHGGKGCPATTTQQPCHTFSCPIDCVVSAWEAWSSCSTTCGGGTRSHSRDITGTHAFGGVECPAAADLTESEPCETQPCPVDCVMGDWSAYDSCTLTCGTGSNTRTRTVETYPQHGGATCGDEEHVSNCNTMACPTDCVEAAWSSWSACDASCGTGYEDRNRGITTQPSYGGVACGETEEVRQCNTDPCPIDCVMGDWSTWSACDVTCGGGTSTRSREIDVDVVFGGVACPDAYADQPCNDQACPIDCVTESWTAWSACSASCGPGEQSRTRAITTTPAHGGRACPETAGTQGCNEGHCPIHCEVGDWSSWSECDKSCGSGSQSRSRDILTQEQHGGSTCPFLDVSQSCNDEPCPLDCVHGDWSAWSECTYSCGTGQKSRSFTITTHADFGGRACPASAEDSECNSQACPIDCVLGDWNGFSNCDKSCGTGIQSRERSIAREHAFGGAACPDLIDSQNCNAHSCPVDCVVPAWTDEDWGACSVSCGGGTRTRTRVASQEAQHGGVACAALTGTGTCNAQPCPIDCEFTESGWSTCSATCGGGLQTKTRTVTAGAQHGGKACPTEPTSQACGENPCPADCTVGDWSPWSECSKSCDGGMELRTRDPTGLAWGGGTACPQLAESRPCNEAACHEECSHVYCTIIKRGKEVRGQEQEKLVKVMHDSKEEHGQTHACKIIDNQCKCLCFDTAESFMAKALSQHFSRTMKDRLQATMASGEIECTPQVEVASVKDHTQIRGGLSGCRSKGGKVIAPNTEGKCVWKSQRLPIEHENAGDQHGYNGLKVRFDYKEKGDLEHDDWAAVKLRVCNSIAGLCTGWRQLSKVRDDLQDNGKKWSAWHVFTTAARSINTGHKFVQVKVQLKGDDDGEWQKVKNVKVISTC